MNIGEYNSDDTVTDRHACKVDVQLDAQICCLCHGEIPMFYRALMFTLDLHNKPAKILHCTRSYICRPCAEATKRAVEGW